MTRSASDMSNPYLYLFSSEFQVLAESPANLCIIDVSVNSFQRPESFKSVCRFKISNVACVPYLINIFKVLKEPRMYPSMRIGDKTYFQSNFLNKPLCAFVRTLCAFVVKRIIHKVTQR